MGRREARNAQRDSKYYMAKWLGFFQLAIEPNTDSGFFKKVVGKKGAKN